VFIFGEKADRQIGDISVRARLVFGSLADLDGTFGNEDLRREAFEQLQKLKEAQSVKQEHISKISESTLPSLTSDQVLIQLRQAISGQDWVGTTKDGRIIRLSIDKKEKGSEDIALTFSELFAMKLAMETLGIREFDIVNKGNQR
jgi:hypothetical protein